MSNIGKMSMAALKRMLDETGDTELIDAILDELEAREIEESQRDWTESDYYAAQSERLEMWRNEY